MGRARGGTHQTAVVGRRGRANGVAANVVAPALTRETARRLCADYQMELAPALDAGVFYHVTCADELAGIQTHGLHPDAAADRRNFTEYAVDEETTYLWGSVGAAQAYAWEHDDRFNGRERVILQAQLGPDAYGRLAPDQEDFARLWNEELAEPDEYQDETVLGLHQRLESELGGEPAFTQELGFDDAVQTIRRLSPETQLLLANHLAWRGDAVMVRQGFQPRDLTVMQLNDYETLMEQFDDENPDLQEDWDGDPDDEDGIMEAYDEARDTWLGEQLDGKEIVSRNDLQEQIGDPSELVHDDERRYYNERPLADYPVSSSATANW